jgi:protein involved in polysaccharide export with SLBB domain
VVGTPVTTTPIPATSTTGTQPGSPGASTTGQPPATAQGTSTTTPPQSAGQAPGQPPASAQATEAPATTTPNPGPNIFGLDLFRRSTSQFDPTQAGAADPGYRVGPGDVLVLILTGGVEASYTLEISREGFVVIPQVGQLYVANLTLEEVKSVFATHLSRAYSGLNRANTGSTKFTVTIARVRTNQIFVIGEATSQGSYQVSALGTLLTALYAAGGPSVAGSMRAIEARRAGRTVSVFDLYDYLLAGDASHDIRLENGDVVFVPPAGKRVTLTGEVGRPSIYELKPGETLRDALRMAGGLAPTAARQRLQIERILPPAERQPGGRDRVVIDVPLDATGATPAPSFPLETGDVISVLPITNVIRNRIVVQGDVWMPGPQGLVPGMRLSDALRAAGGVKPDVFTEEILITRVSSDSVASQIRARLRDTSGTPVDDILLRENDDIHVFSRNDMRSIRDVSISGAVRNGGSFPFREGMRLRDLVLLAGGFPDSADVRDDLLVSRMQPDLTRTEERLSLRSALNQNSPLVVQPGDQFTLATYSQYRPERYVSVSGDVRSGGQSPFAEGMTLRDAIQRAGGLQESADLRAVEIARLPTDRSAGKLVDTVRAKLDSTYLFERGPDGKYLGPPGIPVPTASAPEVTLNPYDRVVVFRQPSWELHRTVTIAGEVQFPADYSLSKKQERISDIIRRAGGITTEGYPGGATLIRREAEIGRINIDLSEILKHPGSRNDLVLEPGDALYIPHYLATVRVVGAVNAPTSVAFKSGAPLSYYVDQAGGFSRLADKARSFVTDANGRTQPYKQRRFLPDTDPVPSPGATVTVPVQPESTVDYSSRFNAIAQMLLSAATLIAIVRR